MEPKIKELIHKHLGHPTEDVDDLTAPKARIILTGHSAGGGVAALLYLHYLLNDETFKGFDLRCITFAAPPVIYEEVNIEDATEPDIGRNYISIINEGDPVPRIERAYILSLADLYGAQNLSSNTDADVLSWEPPSSPQLHISRLSSILTIHIVREGEHGEMEVKICHSSRAVLENTIALDFERHKMKWYLRELEAWAGSL